MHEANFVEHLDTVVLAKASRGVSPGAGRAAIERAVSKFPNLTTKDQAGLKQEPKDHERWCATNPSSTS